MASLSRSQRTLAVAILVAVPSGIVVAVGDIASVPWRSR
jgi:hypothetical protein